MLSQDEESQIIAAPPTGRKENVQVRIDYEGGDKQDPDNYSFGFKGNIVTSEGILACLGPPGTHINGNRYVLIFQAVKGNYLKDASFMNPASPHGFDFVAGVIEDPDDPCCITVDATEFEPPVAGPRETIVLVDLKKNSGNSLGYKFTIWVTHYDGTVVAVPCDPRIINR